MKRAIVIILALAMILTSSVVSFAKSGNSSKATIKLEISNSKEDKEIIKQFKKNGDNSFTKENNNIVMDIDSVREVDSEAIISGKAIAKMFGESYDFTFKDKSLKIKM